MWLRPLIIYLNLDGHQVIW